MNVVHPLWIVVILLASINVASGDVALSKREKADQLYEEWTEGFDDLPEISIEDFNRGQGLEPQKFVLVDVRDRKEQQVSMIPGAIPHRQFLKEIDQHRSKVVVTYCTIGSRSGKFARKVRKKYGLDARNLQGSLLGWTHEGGPLVTPAGELTNRVHVYGRRWSFAADNYVPVW